MNIANEKKMKSIFESKTWKNHASRMGKAAAARMTPEQRRVRAVDAARKRWGKCKTVENTDTNVQAV